MRLNSRDGCSKLISKILDKQQTDGSFHSISLPFESFYKY